MIRTENVTINGVIYTHTWSDSNVYIHGGSPEADYDEAYDPVGMQRTYVETDIPIEDNITKEEAYDILMGEENAE